MIRTPALSWRGVPWTIASSAHAVRPGTAARCWSAWQRGDAGTEELRVALQQYRTFWNRLEDFSRAV
jgi:hypothetical protein